MDSMGLQKKRKKKRRKSSLSRMRKGDGPDGAQLLAGYSSDSDYEVTHFTRYAKSGAGAVCTGFDKLMAGLLILALLVILALSIVLVVTGIEKKENEKYKSCTSPECVEISAAVLNRMDLSVTPCEDFYTYACGGFERDPMIPPEEPKHSMFSYMDRRSKSIIKKMLDDKDAIEYGGRNSSAISKAKRFYSVCMNKTANEALGIEPLLKLISEVGSWTVTEGNSLAGQFSADTYELEHVVAKLHGLALDPLFGCGISIDDKNSSLNVIKFDQSGLSFSDITHYTGNNTEKYRTAFVDYFTEIAELLGGVTNSRQLGEDVWEFETKLAHIMDKPDQRVNVRDLYNMTNLHDLQQLIDPSVDGAVFNLAAYMEYFYGREFPNNEPVVVYASRYLGNLSSVLRNTSTETLANYLAFSMVQSMMPYMPQAFRQPQLTLRQTLLGVSEVPPHWLTCVGRTAGTLGFAVGALYVEDYFSPDDKDYINQLLDKIVSQFDETLQQVSWMDETTREKARDKLSAVGRKIGYPDYIKDVDQLDEHYEKLIINDTTGFENALNARVFAVEEDHRKYGQPPDPTVWSMVPTEINAYYSSSRNEMVFPAGILSDPFYSASFPSAMNFGSMGFIMGHELSHGFDNTGRLFDKDGNLENWWSTESESQFEEKTQCLVDQYGSYQVGDMHLNGLTTLGENIADNGGIKTSFEAYQQWLRAHDYTDPHSQLPALNMTHNQLFFLAYAQTWCTYMTPEYEKAAITTDVHSNAKYRVIGALSNSPEFARAYKCKLGSALNPAHKCSVW